MNIIKGIYNRGCVKKTLGQRKKHRIQMNNDELLYLKNEINAMNLNKVYFSKHVRNKGISCSLNVIREVLSKDNIEDLIIEYNETPFYGNVERRVLIRDNEPIYVHYCNNSGNDFSKESNLCFVICIDNCKIVTVYYNIINDNHDTLNLTRYSSDLIIIK